MSLFSNQRKTPEIGKDVLRYAGVALGGLAGGIGGLWLSRRLLQSVVGTLTSRLLSDPYQENLWGFVSASIRTPPMEIVETKLRAQEGKALQRPFGSPRRFHAFEGLMFDMVMLDRLPTPGNVPVDTSVVLGKRAKRPLRLELPVMVSGMAYGLALSERAKVALAKGTALAGTATNTGEGPFLPAERAAARSLVIQYNRGSWNKEPEILRQADMIEIQFGQGAQGAIGHRMQAKDIDATLRTSFGLQPGQDAIVEARQPGITGSRELRRLVDDLRRETGGVPIGVKLGAGKGLERDLAIILDAGVDYVAIDGAGAATKGAPPILEDDFGLPTVYALCRAARFVQREGLADRTSLIVMGGLATPGDYLKALALGADAVYIGTVALLALAHTQIVKSLPWEPPTQLIWYRGADQHEFNVGQGAKHLANYLLACKEEMVEGIRALGKQSVAEVNLDDLVALDQLTADITGATRAY